MNYRVKLTNFDLSSETVSTEFDFNAVLLNVGEI